MPLTLARPEVFPVFTVPPWMAPNVLGKVGHISLNRQQETLFPPSWLVFCMLSAVSRTPGGTPYVTPARAGSQKAPCVYRRTELSRGSLTYLLALLPGSEAAPVLPLNTLNGASPVVSRMFCEGEDNNYLRAAYKNSVN